MKKYLICVLFCILMTGCLEASELFKGQQTARISTALTASGIIMSGPGVLHGLVIITDGKNAVTITLYDNTTNAAGTMTLPASMVFAATPQTQAVGFTPPLVVRSGVYATIAIAGGGTATVYGMIDQ